ncbi:MAG: nucleoside monophosphate kinase [Thermoplasmata archaeon]|nr:nucleoside monophosphate kinase [Thermoplasmata archaeon]
MKLVLIGPPGSGKGTQARMISEKHGIPHIEAGELLRKAISHKSKLTEEEKITMGKGELLPDTFVADILTIRLLEKDARNDFVLDGYPRTFKQAELLEKISNIDLVLNIRLSPEETVKRLSGRRSCTKCNAVYNTIIHPPNREGHCDVCGGALFIRDDDKPEIVIHRIDVYETRTKPLIEYYEHRGILESIDGSGSIMEIFNNASKVLEKRL